MTMFTYTDKNGKIHNANVVSAHVITASESRDGTWTLAFHYGKDYDVTCRFASFAEMREDLRAQLGPGYMKLIGLTE